MSPASPLGQRGGSNFSHTLSLSRIFYIFGDCIWQESTSGKNLTRLLLLLKTQLKWPW